MKRETISKALNGLDDIFISEAAVFSPDAMQGSPERVVHMKKKRIVSLALAAALVLALGTVAYAAYFSMNQRVPDANQKNIFDRGCNNRSIRRHVCQCLCA